MNDNGLASARNIRSKILRDVENDVPMITKDLQAATQIGIFLALLSIAEDLHELKPYLKSVWK